MATPPPAGSPSIDVVVVTYNPGDTLASFLDSLDQAGAVRSVTVVDSHSPEKTAEAGGAHARRRVPRHARQSRVRRGRQRRGTARLGALHRDLQLRRRRRAGAFSALADAAAEDPRVGAVGPRILETDGSLYPSARPLPSVWLGAGHALFGRMWPRQPVDPALPSCARPRRAPGSTSAGSRVRAWWCAGTPSRRSGVSTRASSCSWRTWIWVAGSRSRAIGPAGCRRPS